MLTQTKTRELLPDGSVAPRRALGLNALHGYDPVQPEQNVAEQIKIPSGWGTLIYPTDAKEWPIDEPLVTVKNNGGLPAIKADSADTVTKLRIRPNSDAAELVEVRVVVLDSEAGSSHSVTPEKSKLIQEYYKHGHPVIPPNEQLARLGKGVDPWSGSQVAYYVPVGLATEYAVATAPQKPDPHAAARQAAEQNLEAYLGTLAPHPQTEIHP